MARSAKKTAKKVACYTGGFVFMGLGFAGMLLPLFPTTVFWILAAWLFAKSHPEMQHKIYGWPKVGPVVKNYLEEGVISRTTKKASISGIILVGSFSLYITSPALIVASIILSTLGLVVLYIASRPECDQKQ